MLPFAGGSAARHPMQTTSAVPVRVWLLLHDTLHATGI